MNGDKRQRRDGVWVYYDEQRGLWVALPTPPVLSFSYSVDTDEVLAALRRADDTIVRQRAELDQQQVEKKPTPAEVIEKYYRRRARNKKITLKQVCADMGVNYASIRVAKVAYDKQRRRDQKR